MGQTNAAKGSCGRRHTAMSFRPCTYSVGRTAVEIFVLSRLESSRAREIYRVGGDFRVFEQALRVWYTWCRAGFYEGAYRAVVFPVRRCSDAFHGIDYGYPQSETHLLRCHQDGRSRERSAVVLRTQLH